MPPARRTHTHARTPTRALPPSLGRPAPAQGLVVNVDPLPNIVDKVVKAAARLPDDSARYELLNEVRGRGGSGT